MKILFPIGSFYPTKFGGPGTMLYWHTKMLTKYGIDVTVVTTTEGIEKRRVQENIFINDKCGRVYYGRGGVFNLGTLLTGFKEIKKTDVMHLTSIFSPISIFSFLYASFFCRNVKIVWSVRGELNENALSYNKNKKKILLWVYKSLLKKTKFVSTSVKETLEIRKVFQRQEIIEMPNLIHAPKKEGKDFMKKQILFMGRIHPIKNIDKLIKAIHLSEKFSSSNFKLIVAGEYEEQNKAYFYELKEMIKSYELEDKVEFVGHISGVEKEKLYAESYFLFLLSKTENFGNVVVEALNQGTPVIASKGSPWELLEKYNCGYWIDTDPEKIAHIIDFIIELPKEKYVEKSNNAMVLVDENYNIENRINEWVSIYNRIINSKGV